MIWDTGRFISLNEKCVNRNHFYQKKRFPLIFDEIKYFQNSYRGTSCKHFMYKHINWRCKFKHSLDM